jgi:hypothetical protein
MTESHANQGHCYANQVVMWIHANQGHCYANQVVMWIHANHGHCYANQVVTGPHANQGHCYANQVVTESHANQRHLCKLDGYTRKTRIQACIVQLGKGRKRAQSKNTDKDKTADRNSTGNKGAYQVTPILVPHPSGGQPTPSLSPPPPAAARLPSSPPS